MKGQTCAGKSESFKLFLQYIIYHDSNLIHPRLEDSVFQRDLMKPLGTKLNPFLIYSDSSIGTLKYKVLK